MHEGLAIQGWEGFYVIVGTSAGALIGLQFVVLTLISESGRIRGTGETLSAFGSPNVVHFCAALLVSAIMTMPWTSLGMAGGVLTPCAIAGIIYSFVVMRRARRQSDYRPVLEDWVWHVGLPIVAYSILLLAAIQLPRMPAGIFIVGGASLLLVFVGIHNAWDTVLYVMVDRDRAREVKAGPPPPPQDPPVEAKD